MFNANNNQVKAPQMTYQNLCDGLEYFGDLDATGSMEFINLCHIPNHPDDNVKKQIYNLPSITRWIRKGNANADEGICPKANQPIKLSTLVRANSVMLLRNVFLIAAEAAIAENPAEFTEDGDNKEETDTFEDALQNCALSAADRAAARTVLDAILKDRPCDLEPKYVIELKHWGIAAIPIPVVNLVTMPEVPPVRPAPPAAVPRVEQFNGFEDEEMDRQMRIALERSMQDIRRNPAEEEEELIQRVLRETAEEAQRQQPLLFSPRLGRNNANNQRPVVNHVANQAFLGACFQGNLVGVRNALRDGADINVVGAPGAGGSCTGLQLAVLCNRPEVVDFLLREPAIRIMNRNVNERTALQLALDNNRLALAERISQLPINQALLNAAASGNIEGLRAALEGGADVNSVVVGGFTALQLAIQYERSQVIGILLNAGADLVYFGNNMKKNALEIAQNCAVANPNKPMFSDIRRMLENPQQTIQQARDEEIRHRRAFNFN